ncbi:CLUMA_CG016424, isoform A [Clunio marinus]|uniref:CLUMA_CG016424, isoform A n=1 Tax=Clunio marinus TaxID=568069 RepID=A0A1J1IUB7_9DIPT|nr:CLUMA_CG016424, isoform A [Clunio marinus]
MTLGFFTLLLFTSCHLHYSLGEKPTFKICVPAIVLPACTELMNKRSEIATIECIAGRDRVECLNLVERREADFMAVDPEDLYLAMKKKNEDYSVFADIRTKEELMAEFRYEGILLVKKNSGINSLSDLRGKKSCHTGYGRNVGYKIPITKLKSHNLFKIDPDTSMSPVERELKALSEFFSESCLVGKYSSNEDVNRKLKKSYPNLCALCADPIKCDYPDRFSGYDGSILCLAENGGDVAFTKVIYVRKYFGLPIGHATKSLTEPQADPNDYEYLCEDGSKVPVTGKACSWAARPWQAYIGNGDINQKEMNLLQQRLRIFYEDAKSADHEKFAKQMMVNEKNTVVAKEEPIYPRDHLLKAKYADVIERSILDGSSNDEKINVCVSSNIEMRKCQVMRDVAFSRDIRPSFDCILKDKTLCSQAVKDGQADAIIVQAKNIDKYDFVDLMPIVFEAYDDNNRYVVIADADTTYNEIKKSHLKFDSSNLRSVNAALQFLDKRRSEHTERVCPNNIKNDENGKLQVVNSKELHKQVLE